MSTVSVQACAKVNLTLTVTGRRPDGYHTLESLVAFFSAADDIQVAARADDLITLDIAGPFADALNNEASENIITKAARLLCNTHNLHAGASIRLTKNLPIAAGIGGGSADAAATLRALARIWQLPNPDELPSAVLTNALGADVPVCLSGVPCIMTGIGETISPLTETFPPIHAVLFNPGIPVSTATIFKELAQNGLYSKPPHLLNTIGAEPLSLGRLTEIIKRLGNDLQAQAEVLCPPISEALTALANQPACAVAKMSGSGATIFGLFPDSGAAKSASDAMLRLFPHGWSSAGTLGFAT